MTQQLPPEFAGEYASALASFLQLEDEAGLQRAYELGRAALNRGVGVVHLATVHQRALDAAGVRFPPASAGRLTAVANSFLTECLSPFEMSLRGYRDTNQRLNAMNEELRRANDAADQANRELESFSYSVAHDLRAPLRSIDGFSRIVIEENAEALGAEARSHLQRIVSASRQMSDLIDGLLTLARLSRGEIRRIEVDLTALATEVVAGLRQDDPAREVETRIQPNLRVQGDPSLLRQLLENLLGNAWKFTGGTKVARIDLGALEGSDVLVVRDNGAGFDPTFIDKLFLPFQRLHRATEFPGTGIGLATVRRIVERHGGRIWAEGRVGGGAAFFFSLPNS
jgi:signal transduction histidine kinase